MASATSSCPIGIDDEKIDLSNDELDMDTNTQGIRCAGSRGESHRRGGRPPISGQRRLKTKRSSVWDHFTKDETVLKNFLLQIVTIVRSSINVILQEMAPLTCCTILNIVKSTRA
jgi:hypothetical protein